jgi:hypothetical protein
MATAAEPTTWGGANQKAEGEMLKAEEQPMLARGCSIFSRGMLLGTIHVSSRLRRM